MNFKGAEATLEIDENVVKKREPKKYRNQELDTKIRKKRTETEMKIMKEARKHEVSVPQIEQVDDHVLEMEKIEGEQLKDVLKENLEAMEEIGRNTSRLHKADIIHGDLTTRNVMLGDSLYLIDFGLAFRSQKVEDRAVDIHLLKQVLESSHPEVAEEAWENFLQGYRDKYKKSKEVLERLEEVEKRGRYK